jgi:hypothetical protein
MPPCSKAGGDFWRGKIANTNQHRNDHAERAKLKKEMNEAAGLVSDRFPSVAGMVKRFMNLPQLMLFHFNRFQNSLGVMMPIP